MSKKEISLAIPFYLADNKLTAGELAKQLGVCRQTVYRWIAGKSMENNNYVVLSRLLENYKKEVNGNGE